MLTLLLKPCYASSDWIYETGNRDTKIGNSLICDEYTITLKDYYTNDDGLKTRILIEIANGEDVYREIVNIGTSVRFGDDKYSFTYVNCKKEKINIAIYKYICPRFGITSETKPITTTSKYNYESEITLTCYDAIAYNIKVTFDNDNVIGNFDNFKLNRMYTKKSKDISIKYLCEDAPTLIMNVEYEDKEGHEYTQSYDVLGNLVITENENSEIANEKTQGVRVVQRYSKEYYPTKAFIRAIEIALDKISFTESEKLQLEQIKNSLEQSL